jgi:hypothetical protein
MTLNLYYKIKEAYEISTHNTNYFKKALESIKWDNTFFADGEHYFIKADMTFTTPSLDPFNMDWRPSALFEDGSFLEF